MTNKETVCQLYERMVAEQQKYKAWLLEQSPNVILDNVCKFTAQEDTVMELEVLELTDVRATALLRSQIPLADAYRVRERAETHHMDGVRDVIEARIDTIIRAEKEKGQREEQQDGLCHPGADHSGQGMGPADLPPAV